MFEPEFQHTCTVLHAMADKLAKGIQSSGQPKRVMTGMVDAHNTIQSELERIISAYTRIHAYEPTSMLVRLHSDIQSVRYAMELLHNRDVIDVRYAIGYLSAMVTYTEALEHIINELKEPCEYGEHELNYVPCTCEACMPDIADVKRALGMEHDK